MVSFLDIFVDSCPIIPITVRPTFSGFPDTGAYWLHEYETESFKDDIEELWQTMKPFYQQVHAYVRGRLRKFYGTDKFGSDGLIPAHLLGA
jgi:peptidyl-dipeptidase A